MKKISLVLALSLVLVFGLAMQAAALTTFQTFSLAGTLDNLPVSGVAKFTLDSEADSMAIDIWNTQANPTAIIQCISDLFFTMNDGNASGTLDPASSGLERTIAADGTFTDGNTVNPGWALTDGGGTYHLTVLGAAGPEHLIIGAPDPANPTLYSAANSSIAGSDPHNPLLFAATEAGAVHFQVDFSTDLTDAARVGNVIMSFGTEEGRNVVPLPPSAFLLGSGLLGLLGLGWRRRVRS
jgi:hypothetical protein